MPPNHLIFCCSLLLLPSIFPRIRVFSTELVLCIRWPNYWSFNFSISPSSEYSGLISLRMDWFDLTAVQGTLKSFLQYHRSKASVYQFSFLYGLNLINHSLLASQFCSAASSPLSASAQLNRARAVLEKTLRVPWTARRLQPVHPKGDQSCEFTGRTDAEVETPILWPLDAKS